VEEYQTIQFIDSDTTFELGNIRSNFRIGTDGCIDLSTFKLLDRWGCCLPEASNGSVKQLSLLHLKCLSAAFSLCLLINCKNIEYLEIKPPKKLQKKRKKNNKRPLLSYHLITISNIQDTQTKGEPQNLWQNRVHLCRGHIKTFDENNPLFGKYTGSYWWQPYARGNKKLGMITKDYEIKSDA